MRVSDNPILKSLVRTDSDQDYELGKLYGCMGNTTKAIEHLELVVSGKRQRTPLLGQLVPYEL